MSVEVFCYRLGKSQLPQNDKKWMPRWMVAFAEGAAKSIEGNLVIERQAVLDFRIRIKSGGAPAWQRLQALLAVEWYQELVLDSASVDMSEFCTGLLKLVAREKNSGTTSDGGMPGEVDSREPMPIQSLRCIA